MCWEYRRFSGSPESGGIGGSTVILSTLYKNRPQDFYSTMFVAWIEILMRYVFTAVEALINRYTYRRDCSIDRIK